jgi:4-cresol dehydrogenase (hydroxylating)
VVEQGTAWRSLLAEVYILFDEGDVDSALKLGQGLIKDWAKQGVGVVRASPALQSVALEQYNNTGFIKLHSHLEEALA